jgi:hypothetical protein
VVNFACETKSGDEEEATLEEEASDEERTDEEVAGEEALEAATLEEVASAAELVIELALFPPHEAKAKKDKRRATLFDKNDFFIGGFFSFVILISNWPSHRRRLYRPSWSLIGRS